MHIVQTKTQKALLAQLVIVNHIQGSYIRIATVSPVAKLK